MLFANIRKIIYKEFGADCKHIPKGKRKILLRGNPFKLSQIIKNKIGSRMFLWIKVSAMSNIKLFGYLNNLYVETRISTIYKQLSFVFRIC